MVTINGTEYTLLRFQGASYLYDTRGIAYEVFGGKVYAWVPARDGRIVPVWVEGEEARDVLEVI